MSNYQKFKERSNLSITLEVFGPLILSIASILFSIASIVINLSIINRDKGDIEAIKTYLLKDSTPTIPDSALTYTQLYDRIQNKWHALYPGKTIPNTDTSISFIAWWKFHRSSVATETPSQDPADRDSISFLLQENKGPRITLTHCSYMIITFPKNFNSGYDSIVAGHGIVQWYPKHKPKEDTIHQTIPKPTFTFDTTGDHKITHSTISPNTIHWATLDTPHPIGHGNPGLALNHKIINHDEVYKRKYPIFEQDKIMFLGVAYDEKQFPKKYRETILEWYIGFSNFRPNTFVYIDSMSPISSHYLRIWIRTMGESSKQTDWGIWSIRLPDSLIQH